jgi:hypothetical protein
MNEEKMRAIVREAGGAVTARGYRAAGDVRGECAHTHRTIAGAWECVQRDRRACRRHGGYSDRAVMRADGALLSEAERAALDAALDAARG